MGFPFDLKGRFESFIEEFADQEGQLRYQEKIREMETTGARSLYISYNDLLIQDPKLAREILVNPEVSLAAGEEVLQSKIAEISPGYLERLKQVHVRITDLSEKLLLRSLKTEHLGILTCFKGIVIGVTDTKPLLIRGHFKCASCGDDSQIIDFPEGIYTPPYQCRNEQCQRKGSLHLQLDKSVFIDWQKITLQEKPEELPPGQLPQNTYIHILDDLVDHARPGDRVEIVGILKARASRFLKRGQLATYGKFFQGSSIAKETEEYVDIEISDEDELKIIDLSKSPYIIEKIRDSLAPSIYGHDLVKEAIASLLFGGTTKETPDGMKLRGESNILIVGDPGTGKSQILKFVTQLAPRALYTTGKGSTAAGLTAAVIRDQDTGEITLEAGALVLADQGIAMVDEFDKMRPEDRSAIHEAMEQHSYHPSFEITFSNGKKYSIGQYIEDLFDRNIAKKVNGENCEILRLQDNIPTTDIFSTDFDCFFHVIPSHVSRHKAPNHFIKIQYSNGREVIVTPEHPIFIFSGENIDEMPAEEVKEGTFIPAVRMVDFHINESLNTSIDQGRKKVKLPSQMEVSLARFLGYYAAEGYSYEGSSFEVGLNNTDPVITLDMKKCILDTFNIEPIDNIERGRVLRVISKSIFKYLHLNFPELMKKSLKKRIPHKIFVSDEIKKITFLNAAFHGDGAIESESVSYSTSSKKLAEDYQDLLLSLGIHTRIHSSEYITPKSKERRIRYKVYIRSDNLKAFYELIIPEVKNQKLQSFLKRSLKTRGHDVLPAGVGYIIKRCLKKLSIPYNGYFQQAFKENCGITISVIDRYLNHLNTRMLELKSEISSIMNIQQFRNVTNYSQQRVAQITGTTRSSIDYIERGGYVLEKRNQAVVKAKQAFVDEIEQVQKAIMYIEKLKQFRWLRVNSIQRIENSGQNKTEWVYDVTITPTKTFISHGIVLHNTISIAKAGIVATLNARTSILAAANPRRGRWNPFKATADNLNLPPTILSRFDLIFVLEDKPDLKEDHDLASHILLLHKSQTLSTSPPIEQDLLRKYIAYARKEVHPRLSDEAAERLLEYYKELRRTSGMVEEGHLDPIAITPRQLESLVRLSEARAKMRLSTEVSYDDASGAVNLMNATLEKLAKDAETGKLDIDKYSSGISARSRRRLDQIDALIDRMFEEAEDEEPVAIKDIIDKAIEEGLNKNQVVKAIDEMTRRGVLFEPQQGYVKRP